MIVRAVLYGIVITFFFHSIESKAEAPITDCDRYAAEVFDDQKVTEGVHWDDLDSLKGIKYCIEALEKYPEETRFLYQLGRSYYKKEEFKKAYNLLLKAAEKKYAYAYMELGFLHYFEEGVEFNEETIKWFKKALEKKVYLSNYYLALTYQYKRQYEDSLNYLNQTINQDTLLKELSTEILVDIYGRIAFIEHTINENKPKAIIYYIKAINLFEANKKDFDELYYPEAAMNTYNLGTLYQEQEKYLKAKKYYEISIEVSPEESLAYSNLSYLYSEGFGIKQNSVKAIEILKEGLKFHPDDSMMLNNLGIGYENGDGANQSFEEALKYYQLSVNNKDFLTPYINLAYLYQNGYGVEKNISKAKELYQELIDLYNTKNIYELEGYPDDIIADYEDAKTALNNILELEEEKIVRKSDDNIYREADNCQYIEGRVQQGQDQEKSFLKCLGLAESNDSVAQYWIGYFYEKGIQVPKDYSEAGNWYKKAVQLGDEFSKYRLSILLLNGYFQDEKLSVLELLNKLINEPKEKEKEYNYSEEAVFQKALLYQYGIEIEQDYEKSLKLLEEISQDSKNEYLVDLALNHIHDIKALKSGFAIEADIANDFPKKFRGIFEWEEVDKIDKETQTWVVNFNKITQVGPQRYKISGTYEESDYLVDLNGYLDSALKSIELWESNPRKPSDPNYNVDYWITKGSYIGYYSDSYEVFNAYWIPQVSGSRGFLKLYRDDNLSQDSLAANTLETLPINYGNYYAVVIGNNDYEYLDDLETAILDANSVVKVLKNKYGFNIVNDKPLIDASRKDILTTLNSLNKKLQPWDNLLIYYAGHGYLDETNRGYWLPVDSDTIESENNSQWISTDDISNIITRLNPKHILIIADSCYSGSLVIGYKSGGQTIIYDDKIKRIKTLLSKKVRKAMTSGANQPVLDGGGEGHSIFASAFLQILSNNFKVKDTNSLYNELNVIVTSSKYTDQTPLYNIVPKTGDEGGDFIFVPIN